MKNKLISINPATEEKVNEIEVDSEKEVIRKIDLANDTYYNYYKYTTFSERTRLMKNLSRVLHENADNYAKIITEEMGRPIKEARGEVLKSAWCAEHYADYAESYLENEYIKSDATESYVQYTPIGVILGILPWNATFWLASRFFAPALMAGNTCLMKHDSHVPGCALAIKDAFVKSGFKEGVFENLAITSASLENVVRNRHIKGVSFTGSVNGGSKVAAIAASEVKPQVLELGGSDPNIVLKDADLEEAAYTISLSRVINAGQSCIAAKRIIIEEAVYDKMVELLKANFSKFKVGDPMDENTDVGPIARNDLREDIHRQVVNTINEGAKCVLGGKIPSGKGFYYPITMLIDVTTNMTAAREETFGPIAAVMKATDSSDAIKIANDSQYGLGAAIWTKPERGKELAKEIESGQVSINGIVKTDPRLPSGGVKKSGYGRELGPHGIKMFVNTQQVWVGPSTNN
ncbi:MAG: NAD-dependent succinate-semialdehyde dehydrogenase [Deferribacterota bacterium]|nr:NAD-dependent succinate-semialdehyde dehydrogenase [Deferribacterota bacterium]